MLQINPLCSDEVLHDPSMMAAEGFAWTSFHFDGDKNEAVCPVFSQPLKCRKLWWVSLNGRDGIWWCRNDVSPSEWLLLLQTETDTSSIRWLIQEPGETIFMSFGAIDQVFSFDPKRTVSLTRQLFPRIPLEEKTKSQVAKSSSAIM